MSFTIYKTDDFLGTPFGTSLANVGNHFFCCQFHIQERTAEKGGQSSCIFAEQAGKLVGLWDISWDAMRNETRDPQKPKRKERPLPDF